MKTTLLVVGRTVDKNIIPAIEDYTGRIKHFAQFEIEVIPELKNARKLGVQIVSLDEFLALPPLTAETENKPETAAEKSGFDDLPLFS